MKNLCQEPTGHWVQPAKTLTTVWPHKNEMLPLTCSFQPPSPKPLYSHFPSVSLFLALPLGDPLTRWSLFLTVNQTLPWHSLGMKICYSPLNQQKAPFSANWAPDTFLAESTEHPLAVFKGRARGPLTLQGSNALERMGQSKDLESCSTVSQEALLRV